VRRKLPPRARPHHVKATALRPSRYDTPRFALKMQAALSSGAVVLASALVAATAANLPCMVELENVCELERREGLQSCQQCLAVAAPLLHVRNCSEADLAGFCHNTTCITKLADRCYSSKLESCLACTTCAQKNTAAAGCDAETGSGFCREACATEIDCTLQLGNLCDAARDQDFLRCVQCTGLHQRELQAASCTEQATSAFCSNTTCLTNLTDKCSPAAQQGCYACGQCARATSNRAVCGLEQDEMFCAHRSAPSKPAYISCDQALAFFCDEKRRESQFHCFQCTGKYAGYPAMQRAQCSDADEMNFCSNRTCFGVLDAACGSESSCSSCAECVEGVTVPSGLECTANQKRVYCDPLPNAIFAIAGCDKPDSCAQATARTDVYDVLLENFTNGSAADLAFDGRQPNNTNVTGRWGFAAAVLNGNLGFGPQIYVIGGVITNTPNPAPAISRTTEVWHNGVWSAGALLNVARWGHAAAAMAGRIYVVGGCATSINYNQCDHPLGSVELFDPITNTWKLLVNGLAHPRGRLAAAVYNNMLFAVSLSARIRCTYMVS
jgi:hypothetical protein